MRATVKLVGSSTSCAIYTADVGRDRATVSNIQVDGNRPTLGYFNGGLALMEMGGTNADQVVDNVRIFEPRAWSALHIIEGSGNSCVGAVVKDCQIGPAGQAPTGPTQYRLRERETGPYPPYQWADGISLSCRNSVVTNNVCASVVLSFLLLARADSDDLMIVLRTPQTVESSSSARPARPSRATRSSLARGSCSGA